MLYIASSAGLLLPSTLTNRVANSSNKSSVPRSILWSKKDTKEATDKEEINLDEDNSSNNKPCFWKPKGPRSWWVERVKLENLEIGQELSGHVVQYNLEAKTGPKLYFECGIGRTDKNGDWSIVNGMLRLDKGKPSVARKRAARFRQKDQVQLFVSRVQKGCGRLEVCAKIEQVQKYDEEPKISVTTLKKSQEVVGKVVKLYPYGAIIDIGANVRGLLHITKVARLLDQYVSKEEGLKKAGFEKGAKVRLIVESVEKRRLSLDFTDDVKEDARKEKEQKQQLIDESNDSQKRDELDAWKEYGNQKYQDDNNLNDGTDDAINDGNEYNKGYNDEYDEEYEDDYDDRYDEEMDIESSLGLDMY
ncbi:unnamed protein product [Pseudo-nitzschia multistriata]|uniref:S1 motif domain-containing protein n=1 Tax=Pseudo-nitzschia multistriata TaxID=183589 RepID=A0A448Z375_9STRA|nr:unnamed protein product [Pseudo-nitzschia multistriata]